MLIQIHKIFWYINVYDFSFMVYEHSIIDCG